MKLIKSLLITSLLLWQTIVSADDIQSERFDRPVQGFAMGAIIGALLGGPPGAVIGAASGGWFGDRHQQ